MLVCSNADLLVNVFALDDVTSRENLRHDDAWSDFRKTMEAAVQQIAEESFDGPHHDGPMFKDWNGSRLQLWVSRKARIYTLLIFQFDHRECPPPICCSSQDMAYGSRRLIAQYAVVRDGEKNARIESLPECDRRNRRPDRTPTRTPAPTPTLHRVAATLRRLWRRARTAVSGLRQTLFGRLAARLPRPQAWQRLSTSCTHLLVSLRDWLQGTPASAAGRAVLGRILAVVGCDMAKCERSSGKRPIFRRGPFDPGAAWVDARPASRFARRLFRRSAVIALWRGHPANVSGRIEPEPPKDPDSIEYHLAFIHGLRNVEPSRGLGQEVGDETAAAVAAPLDLPPPAAPDPHPGASNRVVASSAAQAPAAVPGGEESL